MAPHLLEPEGNKQYFDLLEEMNGIIEKINDVYGQLKMLAIPYIKSAKLKEMRELTNNVQDEINRWRNKALEFRTYPEFKFRKDEPNQEILAIHYTNVLSDYVKLIDSHKFLLAWNLALGDFGEIFKDSNKKWKISFWIGISIAVISNIPQLFAIF